MYSSITVTGNNLLAYLLLMSVKPDGTRGAATFTRNFIRPIFLGSCKLGAQQVKLIKLRNVDPAW